jgi:hypothetical protein
VAETALLLESGDGFLLEDGATGLLLEDAPTTGLPADAALRYHPTERRRRR